MESYKINTKKRKRALKQITKNNLKNAKGFVKFCYILTVALKILACILGLLNITYVIFWSDYAVDIIFLIMTFGFPYLFSFLPATVYKVSCKGEYCFRSNELLTITDSGFKYSYYDGRFNITTEQFLYKVNLGNIDKVDYSEHTKIITLTGDFEEETYHGGSLVKKNSFEQVSFLNVFDIDINDFLQKNTVTK